MEGIIGTAKKTTRSSWFIKLVVVATLMLTVASISIPNLLRSRIAANEASAVGSVRTINTAVASYVAEHPGQGYPRSMSELSPYIDTVLAGGTKSGYNFRYVPTSTGYRVEAAPQNNQTGQRRFSSDERGVINYQARAGVPESPLDGGVSQDAAKAERPQVQEPRRIMRKASVSLIVAEPASAAEKIRSLALRYGGYVESSRASDEGAGAQQVAIAVRVPVERFDEVRREVRALGQRVRSDEDDARDVTAQYVDLQSNLRNFHAEETQYLEIMRRSGSIKDTLAVAERLADVRGRIERTQGQLNLLAHQTETSVLEVMLCVEAVAQPVDVRWHPVAEIKAAFSKATDDLATYANLMIAVIIRLPVFGLWVVTILAAAMVSWRILRWVRRRFVPAAA